MEDKMIKKSNSKGLRELIYEIIDWVNAHEKEHKEIFKAGPYTSDSTDIFDSPNNTTTFTTDDKEMKAWKKVGEAMDKKMCCKKCSGYFEHRVGSHSDDWGGDSDLPCDCNRDKCKNPKCGCHKKTASYAPEGYVTSESVAEEIDKQWSRPDTTANFIKNISETLDNYTITIRQK